MLQRYDETDSPTGRIHLARFTVCACSGLYLCLLHDSQNSPHQKAKTNTVLDVEPTE